MDVTCAYLMVRRTYRSGFCTDDTIRSTSNVCIFATAEYEAGRSQWLRSRERTVFARSNTVSWVRNPTRGMDVRVRYSVCAVLCVGSGLATGLSPVQGVLPTVYRIKELKKRPRSKGLYSHRETERIWNRQIMNFRNELRLCVWFNAKNKRSKYK
jgi:hypothetical protein